MLLFYTTKAKLKVKPVDVKSSTHIDFDKKYNKDPKFKFGDHVRVSKYKNIFGIDYIPNLNK